MCGNLILPEAIDYVYFYMKLNLRNLLYVILLSNATNNINQIAKRVNSTGIIYKDDINDMKKQIEYFSKELWQIHSLLLNRTSGGD